MHINRITALSRMIVSAAVAAVILGASAPAGAASDDLWLRGAGATFPAPLYKRWIDVYQKQHPGVALSYDPVGSGEGVSRFITGSVDYAGTDAILSDADAAKVANGVIVVPATAGMVVLAYNLPGLQAGLKLPRDVYADIFAGKITRWDDPRLQEANRGVTLPRRHIAVVARLDSSGTTYAFSRHLHAISESWRNAGLRYGTVIAWPDNAMLARGNEGVASRIKISEGSIGYVEYGFAKRLGLAMAALQNKAGAFIMPSEQAGKTALGEASSASREDLRLDAPDPASAESYPIVTFSWLLLYRQYANADKATAMRQFVDWGLHTGQTFAGELGYIPLPPEIAARGAEAIALMR
jgi:phosphate transport system substrate-binding protein